MEVLLIVIPVILVSQVLATIEQKYKRRKGRNQEQEHLPKYQETAQEEPRHLTSVPSYRSLPRYFQIKS